MVNTVLNKNQILKEVSEYPGKKVKLAVTDMDGVLRGKVIHLDKFLSIVDKGFGFCDVVFGWDMEDKLYDNTKYTGWHSGYPDALAKVDLSTYRRIPWDNNIPFFLCDFEEAKVGPLAICPRQVLKKVRQRALQAGFTPFFSQEFEWFNFRETPENLQEKNFTTPTPLTTGMFGYSLLRSSQNGEFFNDLFDLLGQFNVPLEGLHTETGPGVYEAAILYSHILESADRAVLFKAGAKEIGYRHGIMPSFMAKWNEELPGCSGHVHQSLWDKDSQRNLFYEEKSPDKMSKLMKSYMAGVMKLLPEFLPFYAPTVNSYKRLVEGAWAPTTVTWGVDNRTTALRALPGSETSTRLELRVVGSDVNPYLAMAASLASGLYGIERNLSLEEAPVKGSGYEERKSALPRNLHEATARLKESKVARELLGESFVEHFVQTREWEWRQYGKAVTDWETRRYFEII